MSQCLLEIKVKVPFAGLQTSFVSYLPTHLDLGHCQMFFFKLKLRPPPP